MLPQHRINVAALAFAQGQTDAKESAMERAGEVWTYPQAKATSNAALAARVAELESELAIAQDSDATKEQAKAWLTVFHALHDEVPGMGNFSPKGIDCALTAVKHLAARSKGPAAVAQTATHQGDGWLPALPPGAHRGPDGTGSYFDSFSRDQMQAYARAAIAERAGQDAAGMLSEMRPGGALYQPNEWGDAWHALRDDVLSGIDGLDNDQINVVLGMMDNYEPVPSAQPDSERDAALLDLRDFKESQWWLKELDDAVAYGTDDQKRAVGVVRNMLRVAAIVTQKGGRP